MPPGERPARLLQSNLEEVNRLISIVEDLFTLSQMDNSRLPIEFSRVDLVSLLEGLYERARVLAEPKNIVVESTLDGPLLVSGDPYRLIQLFLNLLNNAIRYTPAGGRISLSCGREAATAWVRVRDTGIGIPEKDLELIFDRFYRVDKARSREEGGKGLGLSIVKWIVNAHQGTITVQSEMGKGSMFEVRLPISEGRLIVGSGGNSSL
jgi:signal transduction histidine kinase